MNNPGFYTVGGTVQAGGGIYISRQADRELLQLCRDRVFAYVLTPRQMGKSSLMVQTAKQLQTEGVRTAIVDLQDLGAQVTAEQWYFGFLVKLEDQLELETDVVSWWQDRQHLGVSQRLTLFFREVLLKEIAEPLVIFVDEIDSTLSLDFTDDFFVAIRALYVTRATEPAFQRLSFVLIGVATPGDLIRDARRTPFNVGQRVDLTDFTLEEAMPLATGLGLSGDSADGATKQALSWVLQWTGGHPYLTQRLCQEMARVRGENWTEAEVDRLVSRTFLGAQSEQDNNLQFVRDMLTKRPPEQVTVAMLLQTYGQVRRGRPAVVDEEQSLVKSHLKLAGVVKREGKKLQVRNRVYYRVFDKAWIREHLPESLWQRLKPAMPIIATLLAAFLAVAGVAVYANQQRLIAVDALQQANDQTWEANYQKNEAERQRAIVVAALIEANNQKAKASYQTNEANKQRKTAQQQTREAQKQTHIAQQQTQVAKERRQQAEQQRQFALAQTELAQRQTRIAENQRQEAEQQRQLALEQTTLAELRAKAVKVENLLPTQPLQGLLLAIQATGQSLSTFQRVLTPVQASLLNATAIAREQNILTGHQGLVHSVAFSPDGQLIASGSWDGTVRLWDLQGNPVGQPLQGHEGLVWSVAFSQDGQTLVSSSLDGTICLWDRQGNPIGQPWKKEEGTVIPIATSKNGQIIISGGFDGTLSFWDRQGNLIRKSAERHDGFVSSLALSSNDQTIVSGSSDGTVRLWNLQGNAVGQPFLVGYGSAVNAVAISSDGQKIVSGGDDGNVRLWNRQGEQTELPFGWHLNSVLSVAISARFIASSGVDGQLNLWTLEGEPFEQPLFGHAGVVASIAISPNSETIASGGGDFFGLFGDTEESHVENDTNDYLNLWDPYGRLNEQLFQSPPGRVISIVTSMIQSVDGDDGVDGSLPFIDGEGTGNSVRLWQMAGFTKPLKEMFAYSSNGENISMNDQGIQTKFPFPTVYSTTYDPRYPYSRVYLDPIDGRSCVKI